MVMYPILWAFSYVLSAINGGPFLIGDKVRILTGKYKGQTGVVYEEWKERGQVRVDLGAAARDTVEDVFGHIELILELESGKMVSHESSADSSSAANVSI